MRQPIALKTLEATRKIISHCKSLLWGGLRSTAAICCPSSAGRRPKNAVAETEPHLITGGFSPQEEGSSVCRVMGKRQQAQSPDGVTGHQGDCPPRRSSQLTARGAAKADLRYLPVTLASKAHFFRAKPRPGCLKT